VLERVKGRPLGALGLPIPPESDASPASLEHARQRLDEILFAGIYRPYRPRMRSFALPSFGDGYVRINLRGRERDGRVAEDEYDDERHSLDALVGACRDVRTGLPVSDGIEWIDGSTALARHERPYADGIVRWTRPIDAFEHPELGIVGPFPLHRTGTHSDAGFLWASGPGFEAGVRDERSALDLPPTILAALDAANPLSTGTPIT
jgi:predicted AlkP superfamily phosphohydrolase/phosphomutase